MLKKWVNNKVDALFKQVFNDNVDKINSMFESLEQKTKQINNRIDNIILTSGGTSPTEITDARVGARGTSHPTLKTRLDHEYHEHEQGIRANQQAISDNQVQTHQLQERLDLLYGQDDVSDIFVSESRGNDTTGDGTSERPFRTIQRAVNSIPDVSPTKFWIWCESGRYLEDVKVTNITCSEIHIASLNYAVLDPRDGDTDVFIRSINFLDCRAYCRPLGITFVDTGNLDNPTSSLGTAGSHAHVRADRCGYTAVTNCRFATANTGLDVSSINITAGIGRVIACQFSNQRRACVVDFVSTVEFFNSNRGSNNTQVLVSSRSIVFANGLQVTGTTSTTAQNGGQIFITSSVN